MATKGDQTHTKGDQRHNKPDQKRPVVKPGGSVAFGRLGVWFWCGLAAATRILVVSRLRGHGDRKPRDVLGGHGLNSDWLSWKRGTPGETPCSRCLFFGRG